MEGMQHSRNPKFQDSELHFNRGQSRALREWLKPWEPGVEMPASRYYLSSRWDPCVFSSEPGHITNYGWCPRNVQQAGFKETSV